MRTEVDIQDVRVAGEEEKEEEEEEAKPEWSQQFDYKGGRVPEYLIVIGGTMLGRGITIEGLTVSFYLRTAYSDTADTSFQFNRWAGAKVIILSSLCAHSFNLARRKVTVISFACICKNGSGVGIKRAQ